MPIAREYTAAQALRLINESEGQIVRDANRRQPNKDEIADELYAHAMGRHLVSSGLLGASQGGGPSGPQAGLAAIRDRFLSAPTNVSSGWFRKGDMAVRLCELLNSRIGQAALAELDKGVNRVAIHYVNKNKMGTGLFNPKHASASYQVTPATETMVTKSVTFQSKTGPVIKNITQKVKTPMSVKPVLKSEDVVGIHAVIDRVGTNGIHLQTLFPSATLDADSADYCVGDLKMTITV